jgi:hypothetical protein
VLSTRLSIPALLCVFACQAAAQQRPNIAPDSVRKVVQRFYDWYVPRAAKPRGRDMIMVAATHGPVAFDAELVRWLRIDSTARARAKGEVDGLDGDPYLNSQDPCDSYSAQNATAAGQSFMVPVLGKGGCEARKVPDIIVEIANRGGRWTILEFRDPNRRNEGTIPLLRQLHPKAK